MILLSSSLVFALPPSLEIRDITPVKLLWLFEPPSCTVLRSITGILFETAAVEPVILDPKDQYDAPNSRIKVIGIEEDSQQDLFGC